MVAERRGKRRISGSRRPAIERLEPRDHPAVTATLDPSGLLSIAATGADSITLALSAGRALVNGLDPSTGPANASSVRTLEVQGGPAANLIDLSAVTPAQFPALNRVRILGGGGFDRLIGPELSATWTITSPDAGFLSGAAFGRITTFSFSSIENLVGGSEADTFAFRPGAGLAGGINAGAGDDQLDFSDYQVGVGVRLTGSDVTGFSGSAGLLGLGFSGVNRLSGSTHDDTLLGRDVDATWLLDSDYIYDDGANSLTFIDFDTLRGGSGADRFELRGGAIGTVSARLEGGAGDDRLMLYPGAFLVGSFDGQSGGDTIDASSLDAPIVVRLTATDPGGYTGLTPDTWGGVVFRGVDRLIGTSTNIGRDHLLGIDADATWGLTATTGSYVVGTASVLEFEGFEGFTGGTATDQFRLQPTPSSSWWIDDAGGDDTLDFSGSLVGIRLNLDLTSAQSITVGATCSLVARFENLIGSPFADEITAAPLAVPRRLTGGFPTASPGDRLHVPQNAIVTPGSIQTPGSAPIAHNGWEHIDRDGLPTDGLADLRVTITVPAGPTVVGGSLLYTVTVLNRGPDIATGVAVLAAARSLDPSASPGPDFHAVLGTLAPGASASVTVAIRPNRVGTIELEAIATADQDDPSPADNATSRQVTVVAPPPLGPTVLDVIRLDRPARRTRVLIRFRGELDPHSARDLRNFTLRRRGPDLRLGTPDDAILRLRAVRYRPATQSVVLVLRRRLKAHPRLFLTIDGRRSPGIFDRAGHRLVDAPFTAPALRRSL